MWDLGIERAMKKFLEDPEIRQCIKEKLHRTVNDPSSFYGSPAFKDLNDDCAGALMMANVLTMLISIGGDGVQLLNWGTRTATVISMKCEDLPMHLVQTGRAVTPIIIIEGPTEPATLDHILRGTADFLGAHAPSHTPNGERLLFSNCPGRTGGIKVTVWSMQSLTGSLWCGAHDTPYTQQQMKPLQLLRKRKCAMVRPSKTKRITLRVQQRLLLKHLRRHSFQLQKML